MKWTLVRIRICTECRMKTKMGIPYTFPDAQFNAIWNKLWNKICGHAISMENTVSGQAIKVA